MVAAVHPIQTVELLVELQRLNYHGALYFDTFPDHSGLDPVAEAQSNIAAIHKLLPIAARLADNADLQRAIAQQDAPNAMRIVQGSLFA